MNEKDDMSSEIFLQDSFELSDTQEMVKTKMIQKKV